MANGGFLDNCYISGDISLGDPIDEVGDGICNTTSTTTYRRYLLVDGVTNPRSEPLSINDIPAPTTSKYLVLESNFPNPFYSETTIKYLIKENNIQLSLYISDSNGRLIKTFFNNKLHSKGEYTVVWNGNNNEENKMSAGVYFYTLSTNQQIITKQAILIK